MYLLESAILSRGTEPRNWEYFLKRSGPTLEVPPAKVHSKTGSIGGAMGGPWQST